MGACGDQQELGGTLDFAPDESAIRKKYVDAGQGHVFNGFDEYELNESEKQNLLCQAA